MLKKNLILPEFMKPEFVESLSKIHEKGYDYRQVENALNKATKNLLENYKKLLIPKVASVVANSNYTLYLTFTNQEIRIFDISKYLEFSTFEELKDYEYFKRAEVVLGSVQWPNGQKLFPEILYDDSMLSECQKSVD